MPSNGLIPPVDPVQEERVEADHELREMVSQAVPLLRCFVFQDLNTVLQDAGPRRSYLEERRLWPPTDSTPSWQRKSESPRASRPRPAPRATVLRDARLITCRSSPLPRGTILDSSSDSPYTGGALSCQNELIEHRRDHTASRQELFHPATPTGSSVALVSLKFRMRSKSMPCDTIWFVDLHLRCRGTLRTQQSNNADFTPEST